MSDPESVLRPSARRFADALAARGIPDRVQELSESTRTAADAARAVGGDVRQIVKSLVFRREDTSDPVLLLVSGANRVDEGWVARYVGGPLARADPEFVRQSTGYAIGGVPPAGHRAPLPTFVDLDLLELSEVWVAAGHPHALCRLSAEELVRLTRPTPIPMAPVAPPGTAGGRWVTFDCYGTLVDWRAGLSAALLAAVGEGSGIAPDRLVREYLAVERSIEQGPYRAYREVVAAAAERAAHACGYTLDPGRGASVAESIPSWPAFPDAADGLLRLRSAGYRIGILSNNDRDLLERTIAADGFPADLVVAAEDVRAYKPAPAHWARFLRRSGAVPSDVVHASSSFDYDLDLAGALGFRTAYVERYEPPPPDRAADRRVRRVADLAD